MTTLTYKNDVYYVFSFGVSPEDSGMPKPSLAEVEVCKKWFAEHASRRSSANRRVTARGLSDIISIELQADVSAGAVIQAAYELEYEVRPDVCGSDASFNASYNWDGRSKPPKEPKSLKWEDYSLPPDKHARPAPMKGRHLSEAHKAAIGAAQRGKRKSR